MSTIEGSGKLVTNGLILYLDAANTKSFVSGSTIWNDMTYSNFNCTLTNGPTFNTSNNGSIQFDGTNDYGDMGQILNFTTENFTFSMWIYITSLNTNVSGQGPVLIYKGTSSVKGYYSQINQTDGHFFFVTNEPSVKVTGTANGEILINNWYNITITKSGSSVSLYKNGINKTYTIGVHGTIISSTDNFELGYYPPLSINSNIRYSKFSVYNRALTSSEVFNNFNVHRNVYGL